MREPPADLTDAEVLDAVRAHWASEADAVEYLPVGFGAHHWAVSSGGRRTHFVTLDRFGLRHDAASIEASYATAVTLAASLDFVVAPLPTRTESLTTPLDAGALSATAWLDGEPPAAMDAPVTAAMIVRLHESSPPDGTPRWGPIVPDDLPDRLAALAGSEWSTGPFGERARSALRTRLAAVEDWTTSYHVLSEVARRRPWVVTHGEPDEGNQLVVAGHTLLLDWESVKLAPAERDLRTFVERGHEPPCSADAAMLEMFDLEWRLDEIRQYAEWFAAPHTGNADDRIAMGGLLHELTR